MESLNVSKIGFWRLSENPERLDETRGKFARNMATMLVPLGRLLTGKTNQNYMLSVTQKKSGRRTGLQNRSPNWLPMANTKPKKTIHDPH